LRQLVRTHLSMARMAVADVGDLCAVLDLGPTPVLACGRTAAHLGHAVLLTIAGRLTNALDSSRAGGGRSR
jgi:hypothetical protein